MTYNSEHHVDRCLSRLDGSGYELVVVDNVSEDATVELVRRRFRDVRVIECDRNAGYGAACNRGIEDTSGSYILLLNADAWPVGDAIDALAAVMEASPRAAIVAPRHVDEAGRTRPSVRGFPTVWRLATIYLFLRYLAPWSRTLNAFLGAGVDTQSRAAVEWVAGAAMLVRRRALEESGPFDTAFFMYSEETDLAFRLQRLGWHVLYEPRAEFVHLGGGSSEHRRTELNREMMRSHVRFLDKHHGRRTAERGRTLLHGALRLHSLVFRGQRGRLAADTARWLGARDVDSLLADERFGDPP